MTIEKNKMVSVTYELRTGGKDGEMVEVADKSNPLTFTFGTNMLLPKFEETLSEKEIGDSYEVEITPMDAYGEILEYLVTNIPKNVFMVDGKVDEEMLAVGNMLPMMSGDGNQMYGRVVSVDDEEVIMDFNHPLAGEYLHFTGEVLDIRDATEEELKSCCESGEDCEGCENDHD